jgi:hypothetical protein
VRDFRLGIRSAYKPDLDDSMSIEDLVAV